MDGRTEGQTGRQTDLTKLIFTFLNFVKEPIFDMQQLHVMMSYKFIRVVLCYFPVHLLCVDTFTAAVRYDNRTALSCHF